MVSPVKSGPLTLLMGDDPVEVLARLRPLLEADTEFTLPHTGAQHASSFEIVYRGVSLQLAIGAPIEGMAGLKNIFCNLDPASIRSGIDIGLGDHVAGGERVPAILQGLLGLAQILGSSLGAVAVMWHPAQIVSGFGYFSETVSDYLAGGAFPVLAMVNFKGEADETINSRGLSFLAGQELQIVARGMEQSEMMRRVVRVVHDIATNGPVLEAVKLGGVEPGEVIELQPEAGLLKMRAYSIPNA